MALIVSATGAGSSAGTVAVPSYQIGGDVTDPLWPGLPRPVDVAITNPNPLPLALASLTTQITNISAPKATVGLPCSAADFTVQQYSGAYPLVIPPSSTRTLHDLGIPAAQWPQVALIDRPADQDGCQGASLALSYGGQATLG